MKKKIIDLDDLKLIINIHKGYIGDTIMIQQISLDNEGKITELRLNIWDDISFSAYSSDSSLDKLEFTFDINNPLFFPLNRLLGTNNYLVIDDDESYEILKKYMVFERRNDLIKIKFFNKNNDYDEWKKFGVFIKNIGPDNRSKIIDFNVKIRLHNFFMEAKDMLINDNHQYTLDEYYQMKNSLERNIFLSEHTKLRSACESCLNCNYNCSNDGFDCTLNIDKYIIHKNELWCDKYDNDEKKKILIR